MNIFGKRQRGFGARKSLLLTTTILRGRMAKDDNEQGGGGSDIEVGPGFKEAANRMSGDDNRSPEQKGGGATQDIPDGDEGNADGDDNADKSGRAAGGAADDDGDDDDGDDAEKGDPKPKKKDRNTAGYVRDLKRELRQERAARAAMELRLSKIEQGALPKSGADDTSSDTSGKPDVNDGKKYPLGLLDEGYVEDLAEWKATQAVNKALDGQRRADTAKAEERDAEAHMSTLREKLDTLTDKGAEQFDDFEEFVIEAGLRGDYKLTETTFTAAAEADNGPAILHALAKDPKEALRVSKLSPFMQMKYVAEKDGEISAAKPKARTKPKADAPPADAPRGRNGSTPIRADTDNLDDFRKLFYQK